MKSKRIVLLSWEDSNYQDTIEIDWPKVHKSIGSSQVNWFLNQSITDCQLVVDKINDQFRLVAEFYNQKTLVLYQLMWGK